MKFAKYYNVSSLVNKMASNGEVDYFTGGDKYCEIYICMDTNVFWICRILKGYNEEYERDINKYLVERNRFDDWIVANKICDVFNKRIPVMTEIDNDYTMKIKLNRFFDRCSTQLICKAVILLDDEDDLSNWDCCEANSLEECIDIIDGGYGIEQIVG